MKRCVNCSQVVKDEEPKYPSKNYWGLICEECFYMLNFKLERKYMLKIHTCKCGMSLGIGNILDARTIIYKGEYMCTECYERKPMPNIKITAEVDGKQVPLETVSTETFEAIKALEKPKEIPVARLAVCNHIPRLLFRPIHDIVLRVGTVYALDLKNGTLACSWTPDQDENVVASQYKEVVVI